MLVDKIPLPVAISIAEECGMDGAAWWAMVEELSGKDVEEISKFLEYLNKRFGDTEGLNTAP